MNKLRNIAITMLGIAVVFSITGIAFAYFQIWFVSFVLLFSTIIIGVLSVLLSARSLTWNARSGEQRLRHTTQKIAAQFNEIATQQSKANAELHALLEAANEVQEDEHQKNRDLMNKIHTDHNTKLTELRKHVGTSARTTKQEISSTARASSRHIEALIHLYQRYPDVKLPMPSAGGWAIDSPALAHLLALIEDRKPQRILELGTGTSTIWVGYLCRIYGGKLITLDHLERYLNLTRIAVNRHQLDDVIDSHLAPLEPVESNGRSFNWYTTDMLEGVNDIDMVIIDGPPAATGPQARYPALPQLLKYLAPNATVVLDDAVRQDEAEIVESWLSEYPEFREIEQGTSGLAVLERRIQLERS